MKNVTRLPLLNSSRLSMEQQQQAQHDNLDPYNIGNKSQKIENKITNEFSRKTMKDGGPLKQLDPKLDMQSKETDARKDMVHHIERTFEIIKGELVKEKGFNAENQKIISSLQTGNNILRKQVEGFQRTIEEAKCKYMILEKQCRLDEQLSTQRMLDREEELKHDIQILYISQQKLLLQNQEFVETIQSMKKVVVWDAENEALRSRINDLERLVSELNTRLLDKQDYNVIVQQLNEEINKLRTQLSEVLRDQELKEIEWNRRISGLQTTILDSQQEFQRLSDEEKSQRDRTDTVLDELVRLKKEMKSKQLTHETECQTIRLEFQQQLQQIHLINTKDITRLNQEILKLKSEIQEKLDASSQQEIVIKQINDELRRLTIENETLRHQKQDQQSQQIIKPKNILIEHIIMLEKSEKEISKNLKCGYCKGLILQPVTVIPCGHSYCFDCRKGYTKECFICGPKLKVEAMYRNELLDDIIAMLRVIQNSINTMKQQQ